MTSTPTLAGKRALITGGSCGTGRDRAAPGLPGSHRRGELSIRSSRRRRTRRRTDRPGVGRVGLPWRRQRRGADPRVGRRGGIGVRRLGPVGQQRRRRALRTLETITQADFDLLFQTNVAGRLFVTQAAVAAMTDGGRVVLSFGQCAPGGPSPRPVCGKQGRHLGHGAQSGSRTRRAKHRHQRDGAGRHRHPDGHPLRRELPLTLSRCCED
jgi:hypothetical protein